MPLLHSNGYALSFPSFPSFEPEQVRVLFNAINLLELVTQSPEGVRQIC
jgi:hypothetical protein